MLLPNMTYREVFDELNKDYKGIQQGLMKTDRIAAEINARGLYRRKDGMPVNGKQVYAVVMSHPDTFVKSEGLIRLMI